MAQHLKVGSQFEFQSPWDWKENDWKSNVKKKKREKNLLFNFLDKIFSKKSRYETLKFPTIREVFPRLLAQEMVSVLPMERPTGILHHIDHRIEVEITYRKRPQKIIGGTIESYFMNLIIAWNEDMANKHTMHKFYSYYKHLMTSFLKQYPDIINEYCYSYYDKIFITEIKGEKLKYKFPKERPMPKLYRGGFYNGYCNYKLWYSVKVDDRNKNYFVERPKNYIDENIKEIEYKFNTLDMSVEDIWLPSRDDEFQIETITPQITVREVDLSYVTVDPTRPRNLGIVTSQSTF